MRKGRTEITSNLKVTGEQVKPDTIEINTMLNAFRIAVNGSLTQFSMVDGISDEYEDESGIFSIAQPYAHLKFNDNAATSVVTDDGSGANNGTASVNTSALTITGKINEAFDFVSASSHNIDLTTLGNNIFSDNTGTFALWVNPDSVGTNTVYFSLADTVGSVNRVEMRSNGGFVIVGSGGNLDVEFPTAISTAVWTHIAFVQDGTSIKGYRNGVEETLTINDSSLGLGSWFNDCANIDNMFISAREVNGLAKDRFLDGQIDDFRYYKNTALSLEDIQAIYNSNLGTEDSVIGSLNQSYDSVNDLYSPSGGLQTEEYSSDANTQLLLHCNGTDASTTFTDDGITGHTVTANGNAQLDTAQQKFGTASGLFDGTGDYLSIPDSADWDFGTGDFTIDFWIRVPTVPVTNQYLFTRAIGVNGHDDFRCYASLSGDIRFELGAGATMASSGISANTWHHIAVVRGSGTVYLFLDGILQTSQSNSFGVTDATPFYIASYGAGSLTFNGWIDEFRVSKGIARWISSFNTKNNMTLQSNAFTAEAQPDNVRIVVFEEDVDAITLNTDLVANISRDGGTTFTQATLVDEGNYESNKQILSANVDISGQPAGTSMVYKITTANNKDLKIHGTGLSWD